MKVYATPAPSTRESSVRKSPASTPTSKTVVRPKTSPSVGTQPHKSPRSVVSTPSTSPGNRRISLAGTSKPNFSHVTAKVTEGPYGFVKNVTPAKAPPESQPRATGGFIPVPANLESPCIIACVPDVSLIMEDQETSAICRSTAPPVQYPGYFMPPCGNVFTTPEAKDRNSQFTSARDGSPINNSFSLPVAQNMSSPLGVQSSGGMGVNRLPDEKLPSASFYGAFALPSNGPLTKGTDIVPPGYPTMTSLPGPGSACCEPVSQFPPGHHFGSVNGANNYAQFYNIFLLQQRIQQQDSEIYALRFQLQQQAARIIELSAGTERENICHSTATQTDSSKVPSLMDASCETDRTQTSEEPTQPQKYNDESGKAMREKQVKNDGSKSQPRRVSRPDIPEHPDIPQNTTAKKGRESDENSSSPNYPACVSETVLRQDLLSAPLSENSIMCNHIVAKYMDVEPSRSGGTGLPQPQLQPAAVSVYGLDVSVATASYLQRHGLSGGNSQRAPLRRTGNLMESVIEFNEDETDSNRSSNHDYNENRYPARTGQNNGIPQARLVTARNSGKSEPTSEQKRRNQNQASPR